MKKKIITLLIVLMILFATTMTVGCNRQVFDFNLKFDYALVEFPGGEVQKIHIHKWKDYEGEQIQLISTDGTVYLVSSINTILIKEKQDKVLTDT